MAAKCFDGIIMLIFVTTIIAKEELYGAKKQIKMWDVNDHSTVISKLIEMKNNSQHLIGYLDDAMR